MTELQNGSVSVAISQTGAEMKSIKDSMGTEYLWIGDPKIWAGQAPIMFPICGGLKNDKYIYNGSEYTLTKHGYAKFSEFAVESASADRAVFLLKSDENTKKIYPFDYEFRVIYRLTGSSVSVTYQVKNVSAAKMYFSFGAHEGYYCPEGIDKYKVVFDKAETLDSYQLDGNLLKNEYITVLENGRDFDLDYKYFAVDALVFKKIKSRTVTLTRKDGGKKVRLDFDGFNYFLLWTKPGAPYICMEPWCGIPDSVDSDNDFTRKEGINTVESGSVFERTHVITIGG